jgi:hypothetical protein
MVQLFRRSDGDMGASNTMSERIKLVVIVFLALGVYNAAEVFVKILRTFRLYKGVYFWSLVAASVGIFLHAFGYFFRNFDVIESLGLEIFLVGPGGMMMITGQSIVLYSRLKLISHGGTKDWWILVMILFDLLVIQVGATTLYAGSQTKNASTYLPIYRVWERFQVTAFFGQECIISGIYIYRTYALIKNSSTFRGTGPRRILNHLVFVNLLVIALDVTILTCQYAGLYDVQTSWKTLAYSIKLKFEFYILNRLVDLTKTGVNGGRPFGSRYTGSDGNGGAVGRGTANQAVAAGPQSVFGNLAYARMQDADFVLMEGVGTVVKTTQITIKVEDESDAISQSSVEGIRPAIPAIERVYIQR